MKLLVSSYITVACVIAFVFINSFAIHSYTSDLLKQIEEAPDSFNDGGAYSACYENYKNAEKYIALTVSHSDLSVVEDSFAEIMGAVKARDDESLVIAKSRLIEGLTHVKRLSGVNFDSIF